MNKFLLFFVFVSNTGLLYSQDRHDHIWMIGAGKISPITGLFGGTRLEFNQSGIDTSSFPNPVGKAENTGMCDASGKLLFFASGCEVYDSTLNLMENGDSLNSPGENFDYSCKVSYNYAIRRSLMALPTPGSNSKYSLFHLRMDGNILSSPDAYQHPRSFLQTDIDMTKNGGLGAVTQKNQLILKDTFAETLTATRHANGRDWWIPVMKRASNQIWVYLFGPEGLSGPKISYLPFVLDVYPGNEDYWIPCFNVFSPNGSRYACNDGQNGLIIAHFDRCSGEFSGAFKTFPVPDSEFYGGGVAFSPNSRFLYVTTEKKLLQYDMNAADIETSKALIDTADIVTPIAHSFNQMLLAPDDKIYMSESSGKKFLHVINNPNEMGAACQFAEAGFPLPTNHNFCLPNIPYFRLHELPKSPCDTLTALVPTPTDKKEDFSIQPNPATDHLFFQKMDGSPNPELEIINALGQLVFHQKMAASGPISLPAELPDGLYFVRFFVDGNLRQTEKLVIQKE